MILIFQLIILTVKKPQIIWLHKTRKAGEKPKELKSDLNEIMKGRYKLKNQKSVIKYIKTL